MSGKAIRKNIEWTKANTWGAKSVFFLGYTENTGTHLAHSRRQEEREEDRFDALDRQSLTNNFFGRQHHVVRAAVTPLLEVACARVVVLEALDVLLNSVELQAHRRLRIQHWWSLNRALHAEGGRNQYTAVDADNECSASSVQPETGKGGATQHAPAGGLCCRPHA